MDRYIGRCVDCLVERDLGIFGAVLIQGPKWCGKTTTAQRFAESSLSLSDPSGGFAASSSLVSIRPKQLSDRPRGLSTNGRKNQSYGMPCDSNAMSGEGSQDSSFLPDLRRREPRTSRCTAVWSNRPFADGYHDAFRARYFVGSGLAWCAARWRFRCGVTRIHRRYRRYRGFALPRRLAPSGR